MNSEEYREWASRIADWTANYRDQIAEFPVRAQVQPGEISSRLPKEMPSDGIDFSTIFADFEEIIMPGMTHWQHPSFFAYYPANSSPPSILAEIITASLGANCMLWQTSPAATELETLTLDWLRQAVALPDGFVGVIQDTASSATLTAVLTMRERALNWQGKKVGLTGQKQLRVYSSDQIHSSVIRAIWFAGIGDQNLIQIPTSGRYHALDVNKLEESIIADIDAGFQPIGIIASVGGTAVGGTDDVEQVCAIAKKYNLYVHVDAAWAGAAMICPEFRDMWQGVGNADSVVFNPHKWIGVQFDCSAHFVKNSQDLVKTLSIQPEYLKTRGRSDIINYSEWSIPLGRRFRALKLWFVLRYYGLIGLQSLIRKHVSWSESLAKRIQSEANFEIVTDPILSLFTFRFCPEGIEDLDTLNLELVDKINDDGRIYLTQAVHDGNTVIRFQIGQFDVAESDISNAFDVIRECADSLLK